ncbi:uncharacterized protein LOC126716576 [Quercus robur]|uniref:uncharacterized protein LOC126716576 n=1 Tax=Quercus robur TaxID=38942 RepID=UPI00216263CD|nr:uncharacterized protein LOC126716576 [Quercus robur]
MATETASSDYTSATDHEQTEKKVIEEVKAIEQDSVSFSKESVEEEPKVDESPSPATPLSKLEEVSENKHIEPLIPGVEKTDDAPISDLPVEDDTKEEKHSIPDSHTPSIPLPAPVEDTGNTQPEEQPAVESAVKEAPEQVANSSLEKEQEEKPKVVDAHELIAEATEKLEEPLDVLPPKESEAIGINEIKDSNVESIEVEKVEAAATETDEKLGEQSELTKQVEKTYEEVQPEVAVMETKEKPAEQSELTKQVEKTYVEVQPEAAAIETEEKPVEQSELIKQLEKTYEEVQPEVAVMETKEKPAEQSELTKQVEKTYVEVQPEAAAIETEEKPVEQSELIKQVEKTYEEVETKGSVEVDSATNTGTSAEKDENTQFFKKEQTDKAEEPIVITNSKQVLTDQEAQTDLKEDGGEFCPPSTVSQKVDTEDKKGFSGADEVEELSKKPVVETEKVAEENEAKTVETEKENEQRNSIPEESSPIKEGDINSSISTAEVIEKSYEGENTGRDVEAIEENKGEQNVEDKIPALAETDKDEHLEEKQAEVSTERENTGGRDIEVVEENKEEQNVEDKMPALAETDKDEHLEEKQAEVSTERENTGRDVEVVEENKEEQNVEDKSPAKTNKDEHLEEKQAEVTTAISETLKESQEKQAEVTTIVSEPLKESQEKQAEVTTVVSESLKESQENTTVVSEPLKESQESELHLRSEKTVETGEDKFEKEKVDEVAKSEVQNLEPPVNIGDEIKTSQDQPKELPAKSTQKQSNNIISKVKQSLVKAKKAIIGKSPSSKTLSSDTKGDIKVK